MEGPSSAVPGALVSGPPVSSEYPLEVQAAIVRSTRGPFVLEPARLAHPAQDEVLVRIVAVGMCHTDLAVRDGELPTPLPAVLGHEGSGVVEAVGAGVRSVARGDHVVLTYLSCGACEVCEGGEPASCAQLGALCFGGARPDGSHALCGGDGAPLSDRFFGQSSFASHAIANVRNVVKVRDDAPLDRLGPLGCGLLTGAGTVWNALDVRPGMSFATFGAGAVGLAAAMAAKVAGATTIVCVDRVPSRLEIARELGATHVVNAREGDVVEAVRQASGGGVDAALDTTGRADVIASALRTLRQRGALAMVAVNPAGGELKLDLVEVIAGCKRLVGVIEGGGSAGAMIPRLVDLHMQGRFPFERLVRFYDLADINQAAEDSLSGRTIKPILRLPS